MKIYLNSHVDSRDARLHQRALEHDLVETLHVGFMFQDTLLEESSNYLHLPFYLIVSDSEIRESMQDR